MCLVGKSSFSAPIPKTFDGGQTPENAMQNPRPLSMNPVPLIDLDQVKEVNLDFIDCCFTLAHLGC